MSTAVASVAHHYKPMSYLTREAIEETNAVQHSPVGLDVAAGLRTVNSFPLHHAEDRSAQTLTDHWMRSLTLT